MAMAIICFSGAEVRAEIELPVRNATVAVNSDGNAEFTLREGTAGVKVVVELSKYSDFSVIDGFGYKTPSSYPTTISMNKSNRVNGTYYWRIFENGKYYYGMDRTVTYGAKEEAVYEPLKDATLFDDIPLADGRTMQLKSVWFRSVNTGNRVAKMVDYPHDSKNDISADVFTPNQSMVVKNGIVYIARGSSGHISGWKTDETRMWLVRYDLLTGEELPMLWVQAPDPVNGFVSGNWMLTYAMNWIKADADGTPYFFTICNQSEKRYVTQINLYTLNLDNVSVETHSVTPTLVFQVEDDRSEDRSSARPLDLTVEGSIKSGNFKMYAVDYSHGGALKVNINGGGKMPVWRWSVSGSKAEKSVSYVDYVKSLEVQENQFNIDEFYSHITPVGNDCFYFHSAPAQTTDPWISPMLYRFVSGSSCEVIGHFGNCEDIVTKTFPMPAGVSTFSVEDMQFLAYGQGIDAERGTGVQIVSTPSLTDDFSNHKKAWMLGENTGLSTNRYQSCQVHYIPDEPVVAAKSRAAAEPSTGGRLLMYAGNGGMGLYRLNLLSGTVGVDDIHVPEVKASYSGGVLRLSAEVDGIVLYNLTGQLVKSIKHSASAYDVGHLPAGCYLLSAGLSAAPIKIIVK